MVVYKKISPWGIDKDFSKYESRERPSPIQKPKIGQ